MFAAGWNEIIGFVKTKNAEHHSKGRDFYDEIPAKTFDLTAGDGPQQIAGSDAMLLQMFKNIFDDKEHPHKKARPAERE